ncbi:MAG: patatin-like phospholipase family protein [Candidatus Omnitrophica bacterium]|nr:patatin-like phospholipase family protein [Candidatus Omnitrophota bacterium]
MGVFSFGKKEDLNKEYSLQNIPLFSALSALEIKILEKYVRLVECKKGDVIYEQGSEADAFYIIISGRFRVIQKSRMGDTRVIAFYHRGDYFGEISLLTEKPHSVTIQAVNDAVFFKIDKKDFLKMLSEMPALSFHLSRSLGMRLKQRDEADKVAGSKIVSIFSQAPNMGKTTFAVNLAASLFHYAHKRVVVIALSERSDEVARGISRIVEDKQFQPLELSKADFNHERVMREHIASHRGGFDVVYLSKEKGEVQEKKIISLLTFLLIHYDIVLVDMPLQLSALELKILSQSDTIYLLAKGYIHDLEKAKSTISELKESLKFSGNEIRLIISEEEKRYPETLRQMERVVDHKIFALLPFVSDMKDFRIDGEMLYVIQREKDPYSRVVRYLSRELTGALLGLVLGSGAAFGLAHIGVLKVIEREKIPVDIIAGSSIGAFVGALWCAGYSADELEKIAKGLTKKSAFLNLLGIQDFSVVHQGFFKGHQMLHYIHTLIGEKTFQDLDIPLRVVATDLFTSDEIIFDEGQVAHAMRASISIPGIFRPFMMHGRYMIDGGVIDPLPVKVLAGLGVRKIISVNVLSGRSEFEERKELIEKRTLSMEEKLKTEPNFFRRIQLKFQIFMRRRYAANIFNVLMQTMQFMESKIASTAEQESDVEIRPVVTDAHWAEFYSAEKFIKIGEEKTMEKLEEIKTLVRE